MTLNLPQGNRQMDLLGRDTAGRWLFGQPARLRAADPTLSMLTHFSGLASGLLILGGILMGLAPAQEVALLAVGAVLAVFSLYIGPRYLRRDGPAIAIDPERGEVTLPDGLKIAGTLPMNLIELVLEAEEESGTRNASKEWYVAMAAPASDQPHETMRIQVRLYGPGIKGDMAMARQELLKLGPWR